jgi:RimJ/RimL family protein N-acetyltransferase
MEKMPYQDKIVTTPVPAGDWRFGLPAFPGQKVGLREIKLSDAAALLAMLTTDEVAEFVSPLPRTLEGFLNFISQIHEDRLAGRSFCFGVVPAGYDDAVGLFQVRELEPGFGTAEWGFAIGSPFWGTGVFVESARSVMNFAFDVIGVHRLEARSLAENGRANAALRKIGALQEGVLRRSFLRNGKFFDQVLWSIVRDDWHQAKTIWGPRLH